MDNLLANFIKRATAYFQNSEDSYRSHNFEYENFVEQDIAAIKKDFDARNNDNFMSHPSNMFDQILEKYSTVRSCAVDIGAGAGWLSSQLSKRYKFKKIIAIEPSATILKIAQKFFPATEYTNIIWLQGFAEKILPTLQLSEPAFFFTGCVLSHLRDREVSEVCSIIDMRAPIGSVLSFSEGWGKEWHQLRWHIRTKDWWQTQLPNWEIDFHGPATEDHPNWHMGFHAVKIK